MAKVKMHPIAKELSEAFGVKRGAKDSDEKFAKALFEAATAEDDEAQEAWDGLTEDSQAWVNAATDAEADGKPLPDFDVVGGDADEDDEDEKPAKKGAKAKAKAKDADDEDDEDEDEAPKKKAKPAKGKKAAVDEDDEDEDEDEAPKKKGAASKSKKGGKPVKKGAKPADDEDDEDEKPAKKKKAAARGEKSDFPEQLYNLLKNGGGTVDELYKKLAKKYPDKDEEKLKHNIRAQVNWFLPKKDVKVKKIKKDGQPVVYKI